MPTKEYLDPKQPLLEEVVGWLCRNRIDRAEGAVSLARVMMVVPTAQSGRNLRLALAREAAKRGWGGIIPPKVVQPMRLVRPAAETLREATPMEAAEAFQQYVKAHSDEMQALDRIVWPGAFEELTARFALFDQLEDIWRALAGRGLLMREVPTLGQAVLDSDIGDEAERWRQLAKLEAGYFDFLHAHGVAYSAERAHAAKTHAEIVGDDIDEIVLPALADPVRVLEEVLEQQLAAGKRVTVLLHAQPADADRFDRWGWPKTAAWIGPRRPELAGLTNADLAGATNASALARLVAADFPEVKSGTSLPALALCDDGLHHAVAAAFLNRKYIVHNPERHLLVQSPLGRLVENLIALYPADDLPWREFMSVLRTSDLQSALGMDSRRRASVLRGADIAQNAFIPTAIPRGFAFPQTNGIKEWQLADFTAFCEVGRELESMLATARSEASLGRFLRRMLKVIFAAHHPSARADEKEFLAAAEGTRDLLAALESDLVTELSPSDREFEALARRALGAVAYSLEPDAADAVMTEGWLELPWTSGRQVALVGFHEGKVPDSIVGHPFLPDRLRAALRLVTNEDRLARDTWILKELLDSHAAHAVRVYVARTDDQGDICRPSRLLYLCNDRELPVRVKTLFGDLPVERPNKCRRVEWPLALGEPIPMPDHLSASALDAYVKCPFTYLLKYGLKMEVYREKRELAANDFGTFIHEVLDRYAKDQIERGDNQLTDAAEIRRVILETIVPECRARFVRPTQNIDLQLQAAAGRLALFAERQAAWAQQGWRIRESECKLNDVVPELGVRIRGAIDRVDENLNDRAPKRWCLIDYKTWDKKQLSGHVLTSNQRTEKNAAHLEFAHALGFPCLKSREGEDRQRMLSVQLPVYGKGYAATHPQVPFADMQFSYFILGKNADETGIGDQKTLLTDAQVQAAVATAKRAVELIGKAIFWPPGPTDEWKWDYSGLFVADPKTDLADTPWAKAQQAKLEADRV